MSDDIKENPIEDEDEKFEMTPEEATSLDDSKPLIINRNRITAAIFIFFAVTICGGLLFNALRKDNKKDELTEEELQASRSSSDFISSLQTRAAHNREKEAPVSAKNEQEKIAEVVKDEPLLPPASISSNSRAADSVKPQAPPPPPQNYSSGSSSGGSQQPITYFKSPLVPAVEGRLFSQQGQGQNQPVQNTAISQRSTAQDYFANAAANPYRPSSNASDYTSQNDQQNKQAFYDPAGGGGDGYGSFIGDNAIWQGTVIPAILENAINTDLPGNIIARVSQNIFDSQTGKKLLVPQGTLLLARYNSSVSYAQHRVQIVWDSMIRPDGFQINLDSGSVDKAGMSGQAAKYSENWFEYLKAAGIITLFSIANAKMTESAAKVSTPESSGNIAAANSAFVNQVGSNLISRAMNIQPTLTVDSGTPVNVMLNKTLYLPPVPSYPPSQKYILE